VSLLTVVSCEVEMFWTSLGEVDTVAVGGARWVEEAVSDVGVDVRGGAAAGAAAEEDWDVDEGAKVTVSSPGIDNN